MLPLDEAKAAAGEAGVPEYMANLSIFRILLRHPRLARAANDFLGLLLFDNSLPHRYRELVIMRVGWATGSEYEWGQHWRVAKGFEVAPDDLVAVRDWHSHAAFDDADRAVLAATDEMLDHGAVGEATWAACARHLPGGEPALLELLMAIGAWRMVSGFLRTLEVPLEDFTESWPPDGQGPAAQNIHG